MSSFSSPSVNIQFTQMHKHYQQNIIRKMVCSTVVYLKLQTQNNIIFARSNYITSDILKSILHIFSSKPHNDINSKLTQYILLTPSLSDGAMAQDRALVACFHLQLPFSNVMFIRHIYPWYLLHSTYTDMFILSYIVFNITRLGCLYTCVRLSSLVLVCLFFVFFYVRRCYGVIEC